MCDRTTIAAVLSVVILTLVPSCANDKEAASGPRYPAVTKPIQNDGIPRVTGARLVRRLALDLLHRLPGEGDTATLTDEPETFTTLVNAYLESPEASKALALRQGRIWKLRGDNQPELERLINVGNAGLSGTLTPRLRRLIAEEPTNLLRYLLDANGPFSDLFKTGFTVADDDVLTLWGLTASNSAWPGSRLGIALYGDGRGQGGILATQGFLAAFGNEGKSDPSTRSARILETLACKDFNLEAAHNFKDLEQKDFVDLRATAMTKATCAACHAQYQTINPALAGLASGNTLTDWVRFNAPTLPGPTSYYAGHKFEGLAELGAYIGADPKTHRCMARQFITSFYQRDFLADIDNSLLLDTAGAFWRSEQDVRAMVREIVHADAYRLDAATLKTPSEISSRNSGMRLLSRAQWKGVLEDLSPTAAALDLPDQLDAGTDDYLEHAQQNPSGNFWHALRRTALQAGAAAVTDELADGVQPEARRLLRLLPAGSGRGASDDLVKEQLRALWHTLTAATADAGSDQESMLFALWQAAGGTGSTDSDLRSAWQTTLTGIFMSPQFYTY